MPPRLSRHTWSNLTEPQLLAQCEVDTYRASGPGGQKRNKTSSAVRLRHPPTGLLVIAEESRSQHANKAKALARLRRELFLEWRDDIDPAGVVAHPDLDGAVVGGRLDAGVRSAPFWPAAGVLLDLLDAVGAQVSTAAAALGVTTANVVEFLRSDPRLWQSANRLRVAHGRKPLKAT